MKQDEFLTQLQRQARRQSKLHQRSLLPKQLDSITSFIGSYPWQVVLVLSGITALILS